MLYQITVGRLRRDHQRGNSMMKKLTARATLIYMIKMLTECLEELKSTAKDGFTYGEKTPYAECLEIIQLWEESESNGLDYEIEERFPL